MKKRIMTMLLCLCLLNGTVTAFAEQTAGSVKVDSVEDSGNASFSDEGAYSTGIDINAVAMQESPSLEHTHVYQVEIVWGDMAFAYGDPEEHEKNWNPVTHTYSYNEEKREDNKQWYLVDEKNALTTLKLDDESGNYASQILTGTKQSHVVLINHSDQSVTANVKIDKNADFTFAENSVITPSIAQDSELSSLTQNAAAANENGGWDVQLDYDADTDGDGVGNSGVYSTTNKSIAAFKVSMAGVPAENELTEVAQTVAHITIKLTPAEDAVEEDDEDDEDGGNLGG